MGGEEQDLKPILGREGYLERLTQASFQVRVEEGQAQLLIPDFAYSGFLRPETARIRLYSQGKETVLVLEVKNNFSAGILDLGGEAVKTKENGSAPTELDSDTAVYFKYQNHPGALIALEKVRIGKGADSEYGFKKVFNNRKDLKEYCSAQDSSEEEDLSVLLERAEKVYGDLEEKGLEYNSGNEDFAEDETRSETTLTDSRPAKRKSEFTAVTAIADWFQGCLNQNESGKLLTHEEEVELAKQRDRADYLKGYAFAAAQTAMAVYFPDEISPLFAEAYAVLEAIISSDENGLQNLFPRYFIGRNVKGNYLGSAQEIFPQLEKILALQEAIQRESRGLNDSLNLGFPEDFLKALNAGFAEPDSIPALRLKNGETGLQSKLSGYQQLLIKVPFQDKVRKQILTEALSTILELAEYHAEQKKRGLSLEEKDNFSLILNCSRAYQRGNDLYDRTIDQFMAKNYRLCFNIAGRMSARSGGEQLQLFDCFQDGVEGLKIAAKYFEWKRGYKFCTYATWWIRQKVGRGIKDKVRTVRLPVHVHESLSKIHKTASALRLELDHEPTPKEISAATSISEKKVIRLLSMQRDTISLEGYVSNEDDSADSMLKSFQSTDMERLDGFVHRPLSPLRQAVQAEAAEVMNSALTQLTPMEELIIRMRNGLDPFKREYTLEDVGRELSRTRERVRQIENVGMDKLKSMDSLRSCW